MEKYLVFYYNKLAIILETVGAYQFSSSLFIFDRYALFFILNIKVK